MKINQWLYVDPNDGPSISLIPILIKQFPDAVLCTSFDQVCDCVNAEGRHVVLILPPQAPDMDLDQARSIRKTEIFELTQQGIECVLFVTEIFDITRDFDWINSIPNLLIVTPCQHNFGQLNYPWITWQHWLQDAADVYQQVGMSEYISNHDPASSKPQLFDVLLGGERPYRTLLHDWIEQDSILSSRTVMSYYGGKSTRPAMILEPGMTAPNDQQSFHFAFPCHFKGASTRAGVIPPVSVYQQCAYSVVTETNAQHNYVFFTEKIARVMACERLFVVLSSYRYLHYLRQAGFQTFGDIINESYDLEVDDVRRWRMAFEQMQVLATMDQQQVLERIQPIVKHNRQVLMQTDWHKKMSQQVGQILDSRLQLNLKES
jgi:hypothetical protein